MKERNPLLQAYDRVILRARAMYAEQFGKTRGAETWFANQIGTSRQNLNNWGLRSGVPKSFVDAVSKVTGLKKSEVRPVTILVEVAQDDWKTLAPKELADRATIHPKGHKYG
jgi:hypothetical protein